MLSYLPLAPIYQVAERLGFSFLWKSGTLEQGYKANPSVLMQLQVSFKASGLAQMTYTS